MAVRHRKPSYTWRYSKVSPAFRSTERLAEHALYRNDKPTGWFVEELTNKRLRFRYLKKVYAKNRRGKKKMLRVISTTKKTKIKDAKAARKELLGVFKRRKRVNPDLVSFGEM